VRARRRQVVVALALVLSAGATGPGLADLVDRSVTAVEWGLAAECRRLSSDVDDERCAAIDGRGISAARVASYRSSWVHRALELQGRLDDRLPLSDALVPHTHNSFNSSWYDPTVTNQDPNQAYSLTHQLDMDIRALELDVHWMPSASGTPDTGGHWPTLCHGTSDNPLGVHVGCSIDRPLEDGLREITAWLGDHPDEIVLLYLENQLGDDPLAHATAGAIVDRELGALAHRPPASAPCAPMDWSLSEAAIRATGARVVVVGNCDAAVARTWGTVVHERGPGWDESGDPLTCEADTVVRRFFEDRTWVAEVTGGTTSITAEATAAMVRCGANLIGFDQLSPDDPRLAALVWSWAEDAVTAGAPSGCAYQGADTYFHVDDCRTKRPAACLDASGAWRVTKPVRWDRAPAACAALSATFSVPATGMRNVALAAAKPSSEVWVDAAL
jgi:hypothetical protein